MCLFAEAERNQQATDIAKELREARDNANVNRNWYIAFRVVLFVLALPATLCPLFLATSTSAPGWVGFIGSVCAASSALMTGFALQDLDLNGRRQRWLRKSAELGYLRTALIASPVERFSFLGRL